MRELKYPQPLFLSRKLELNPALLIWVKTSHRVVIMDFCLHCQRERVVRVPMLCCALVLMKSPGNEVSVVYKSSQEAISEPLSPPTSAPISCLKSGRVRPGVFIYESRGSKAADEQKPRGVVQPGSHSQAVCECECVLYMLGSNAWHIILWYSDWKIPVIMMVVINNILSLIFVIIKKRPNRYPKRQLIARAIPKFIN